MELNPRYGDDPILRLQGVVDDPAVPMLRQRARLASVLALLDDEQWSAPSRCDGWSVQDVIAHLVGTNQFWAISIDSGRQGAPTRFLGNFDPVATPARMVESVRSQSPAETLDRFVQTNDELGAAVRDLDDAGWEILAEAPPGHVGLRLVVLHALWDAWIHERDIVVPLGLPTVDEPDEVVGSLTYAAALGPAFLASTASGRCGALAVEATDPSVAFVVDLADAVTIHTGPSPDDAVALRGDAVALVEALSYRAPLEPFVADDDRWLLDGLGRAFDQV
jgi:uncharacterized protein (TIGR03083 family)